MIRVVFRPLLVSGMLSDTPAGPIILVDSDQPEAEQLVALLHESLHLLGLKDEAQVEALAQKLAGACPEILPAIKAIACVQTSGHSAR